MTNCQTKSPLNPDKPLGTDNGQQEERCEYCLDPIKVAVLMCNHPEVPSVFGERFKGEVRIICRGQYLFQNEIPAPEWCPLKEKGSAK